MAKIKGCTQEGCIAKEKKIRYKKEDCFCSKCGRELVFVYIPAKQHNSPEGTACHSASNCTMQLMCKFMLCAYPYRCIPSGTP